MLTNYWFVPFFFLSSEGTHLRMRLSTSLSFEKARRRRIENNRQPKKKNKNRVRKGVKKSKSIRKFVIELSPKVQGRSRDREEAQDWCPKAKQDSLVLWFGDAAEVRAFEETFGGDWCFSVLIGLTIWTWWLSCSSAGDVLTSFGSIPSCSSRNSPGIEACCPPCPDNCSNSDSNARLAACSDVWSGIWPIVWLIDWSDACSAGNPDDRVLGGDLLKLDIFSLMIMKLKLICFLEVCTTRESIEIEIFFETEISDDLKVIRNLVSATRGRLINWFSFLLSEVEKREVLFEETIGFVSWKDDGTCFLKRRMIQIDVIRVVTSH